MQLLSNTLKTTTAINLVNDKFDEIDKSVGFAVKDIIDKPPIAMLRKSVGDEKLEAFLAVQIAKLNQMVNISQSNNFQDYQIPIIAKQLIEMYPVETLEDFVLCFKRGAGGFYGTIYNKLDGSVLCEWMKKYLDEKYTYVEAKVSNEKNQHIENDKVNYEKFRERVAEFIKPKGRFDNVSENDIQRKKLDNPYKYFTVRGVEIYATSQEHAEELVNIMVQKGILVEDKS